MVKSSVRAMLLDVFYCTSKVYICQRRVLLRKKCEVIEALYFNWIHYTFPNYFLNAFVVNQFGAILSLDTDGTTLNIFDIILTSIYRSFYEPHKGFETSLTAYAHRKTRVE